ncbi:MAG TPA: LanC-like protein [Gaiellaceae bacterium]|nr:LanC-like protein [Gaiellaceae bacterium]
MLFTPERHEPLTGLTFSEATAREAIERIAERAEQEVSDGRWPLDPSDADPGDEHPASCLYHGAAGIAWALGEIDAALVDRGLVERLEARILAEPDVPDWLSGGVWLGVAGVLAVAERHWPDPTRRDRLAELAQASLDSPALEILFGHPGHMALAAQLHTRTGEERWAELWAAGAKRLLDEWRYDDELAAWLWTQRFGEREQRVVGAAHGLVGNLRVLLGGGSLLPADRRSEVEQRAVSTLTRLAVVEDGLANWPTGAGGPLIANDRIRVQWCHGAAGVLTSLWDCASDDDEWTELLLAAGRLVWTAGPFRDQPGLCHGTAGNAYALLALWRRTGDEQWLQRAQAFAAHAAGQVEDRVAQLGHGRHSLYTGDEGVAICLASCVTGDERLPVIDRLI